MKKMSLISQVKSTQIMSQLKQELCNVCNSIYPPNEDILTGYNEFLLKDILGIVKEYLTPTLTEVEYKGKIQTESIDEYETKFGKILVKKVSKSEFSSEMLIKFCDGEIDCEWKEYQKFNINCNFVVDWMPQYDVETGFIPDNGYNSVTFVKTYFDGTTETFEIENEDDRFIDIDYVFNERYIVFVSNRRNHYPKMYYYDMHLQKITNCFEIHFPGSVNLCYSFDEKGLPDYKLDINDTFLIISGSWIEKCSFESESLRIFIIRPIICEYLKKRPNSKYCAIYDVDVQNSNFLIVCYKVKNGYNVKHFRVCGI